MQYTILVAVNNTEDYRADLEDAVELLTKVAGSDDRPIPLSLWPTILERAYEKSYDIYSEDHNYEDSKKEEKDATGMYYLLCEGPVRWICEFRNVSYIIIIMSMIRTHKTSTRILSIPSLHLNSIM